MLSRYVVILLLTTTCARFDEDPYDLGMPTQCPVEVWYNLDGVEYYRCYR